MNIQDNTKLLLKFDIDTAEFQLNAENGEVYKCSNIELHNVTILKNGDVMGTYIKCKSLKYYNDHVNKELYPQYFMWCFSDEFKQFEEFEQYDVYKYSSFFLVDNGSLNIEKEKTFDRCFFQIRKHFSDDKATIHVSCYQKNLIKN